MQAKKEQILDASIPLKISPKGIALLAAIETGFCSKTESGDYDDTSFNRFWECYQSRLLKKRQQELDYYVKVLNEQGEERARERAQQRVQQLKLSVLFTLSFALGAILALLFKL